MKTTKYCILALGVALIPGVAQAHAIAGDRVFPATMAIDDPGVSDEITLPQVSTFRERGDDGHANWSTETSMEYSKRITPNFALSVEDTYVNEQHGARGFDNIGIGAKYQFLTNADHELMMSAGLDADIGNTGENDIGEKHSSFTPALFIGKGMGDLPDSMMWLKPLAVTGTMGVELPIGGDEAKTMRYGFTLQYSLPYLQQHVKDVGLPQPIKGLVPVVEFSFETPLNKGEHTTTGTINPGVIWMGNNMQFGLEAIVPMNSATGSGVGAMAQVHFFLDDIFGHKGIGAPIFGQ